MLDNDQAHVCADIDTFPRASAWPVKAVAGAVASSAGCSSLGSHAQLHQLPQLVCNNSTILVSPLILNDLVWSGKLVVWPAFVPLLLAMTSPKFLLGFLAVFSSLVFTLAADSFGKWAELPTCAVRSPCPSDSMLNLIRKPASTSLPAQVSRLAASARLVTSPAYAVNPSGEPPAQPA